MKISFVSTAVIAGIALASYPMLGAGTPNADVGSSVQFAARQGNIVPPSSRAAQAASSKKAKTTGAENRMIRAMVRLKEIFGPDADIARIRPPSALTKPAMEPLSARGVYLTSGRAASDGYLQEAIDGLKASNGNAVIFDVKGSRVYFDTTSMIAKELGLVKAVEDLPKIIDKLHENGIYVMGRFIAIKDDGFTAAHPESSVRHPTTNEILSATWIDPSNEYAQQYNMEVLCDLAKSGIDEVNFDYIRFSTENYIGLGVFSAQQKADKVHSFMVKARETIDRCGASTKLGVSTYAILGWNYPANLETLGQDFVRFAPLVDVISPMAYPATFSENGGYWNPSKHGSSRMYWLVKRTITGYQDLLGDEHKAKLRPWIQGYGVTQQNVQDQIKAVYDTGNCGYQFWNAGNNYDVVYKGMAAVPTPEHCETW